MFEAYKEKYLLNKVLNNNGYLSYVFLQEGSLSLNGRDDVCNFRDYIQSSCSSGILLDIGCGTLPRPGYLDFEDKSGFEFYGLDPIDDKSFSGMRVVGCAEYLPFDGSQFDAIVFATSIDHVCSLEKTISECHRILKIGGRVLIWMSDRSVPPFRLKHLMESITSRLKHLTETISSFRIKRMIKRLKRKSKFKISDTSTVIWKDKFLIYPNWTVLYVPDGAVDPFHSFNEDPKKIVALMKAQGFQNNDMIYNNPNEVFLCFNKVANEADRQ
jgi:SAM-dependent methyltransferase